MPGLNLLSVDHNEPKHICEAIRSRRGGSLNKLDRMLLHSPVVAEGWNVFFGKLRDETILPAKLRELTICVVAIINGATYELEAHAPLLKKAGADKKQTQQILNVGSKAFKAQYFSELEREVISFTIQMTRDIKVSKILKSKLQKKLGSRQLVELIATIAAYNLVSRFLVATEIMSEKASDTKRSKK